MKLRKLAHSCLVIEQGGVKLLTDPGSWNETPNVEGLSAILITHEHRDHCSIEQIPQVLLKNPDAVVITHEAVGELLEAQGIAYEKIEPGQEISVRGLSVKSFGTEHAIILGTKSPCRNTGFLIGGRLYLPGDALHDVPDVPVEFLGLPTGGPWMKISEAVEYALKIQPKIVFPIHDAMYTQAYNKGGVVQWISNALEPAGTKFMALDAGTEIEL